jgi:hypothetical protein
MMGVLFIGPDDERRIAEIIEFAKHRVWDGTEPIDDDAHSIVLGTYIAKFTLTRARDGSLYRHLSVACYPHRPDKLPGLFIVSEIGMAFGFRDPYARDGWAAAECPCGCNAIQVFQRYEP